jgi:amidase
VLAGYDAGSPIALAGDPGVFADVPARDLEGVRIAWSATVDGLPVQREILDVLAAARDELAARGAVIAEMEPDLGGADEVFETFRALGMVSMAAAVEATPDLFKRTIRDNVAQGLALHPTDISRAAALRTALYRRTAALLAEHDVLALPTTQVLPFGVEQEYPTEIEGHALEGYIEWMRSCSRISATTLPAISVPGGFTPDGLPVGLQLVGAPRGELELMRIAAAVEQVLGAGARRPSALPTTGS